MSTFKEVVQRYAQKQSAVVDKILEPNPLYGTATWEPTTHGYRHVYEEFTDAVAMQFVNFNAAYPSVGADFNLKKVDISKLAGTHEVHIDTVREVGGGSDDNSSARNYINDKAPYIIKKSLNNASQQSYYNVFEPISVAKGKAVSATASPSGNNYYSMFIIRWEEGNFSGLVNPNGFGRTLNGDGSMVKITALNGGSPVKNADSKTVYQWDMELPFGYLPANDRNISTIHNIDANNLPDNFAEMLSDQIVSTRPNYGGRTYIYAHPMLISKLGKFKDQIVRTTINDGQINRLVTSWDGIELIGDWNLLQGTEAPVTIA